MPPSEKSAAPPLLVLVRDLMFLPRITHAAAAAGIPTQAIRDPSALATQPGRHLIVDLAQPAALDAAAAWRTTTGRGVTGFVGHLDTQTITRARELGIDRVLARGAFVERLVSILAELRDPADQPTL